MARFSRIDLAALVGLARDGGALGKEGAVALQGRAETGSKSARPTSRQEKQGRRPRKAAPNENERT